MRKKVFRYVLAALLSVQVLGPAALAQPAGAAGGPSGEGGGKAVVIPIKGDIEPALATFIRRETQRALRHGAAFLVYDIDTFGGRVDTALQITSFIGSIKEAKTIAWVRSGPESMGVSWSAGALIAFSCSAVYMANGTSIGAAAPVTIGVGGKPESAGEKTTSAVRSQMAALAEKNGYPAGLALAMVDADVELWEIELNGRVQVATQAELDRLAKTGQTFKQGPLVSAKGKLLSLTAGEAEKYHLSSATVDTLEDILVRIGAQSADETGPTFFDSLVLFLVSGPVQTILILLGLVALFLEINTPGFGIPGVVALVSFLCVFGANALLGSVDSFELILFLAGLGLLAVEIFVLPGFGLAGVSGLLLIAAALIFSMQDFVIPTQDWQWQLLGRNAMVVAVGLLAAISGIALIALFGPKIRMFDRLTLKTSIQGTADGLEAASAADGGELSYAALVGKQGIAVSALRPVGRADIEKQSYTVESDGSFISAGTKVEVFRVRGNRIIVKEI